MYRNVLIHHKHGRATARLNSWASQPHYASPSPPVKRPIQTPVRFCAIYGA